MEYNHTRRAYVFIPILHRYDSNDCNSSPPDLSTFVIERRIRANIFPVAPLLDAASLCSAPGIDGYPLLFLVPVRNPGLQAMVKSRVAGKPMDLGLEREKGVSEQPCSLSVSPLDNDVKMGSPAGHHKGYPNGH